MLRIYSVCLAMVRDVAALLEVVGRHDKDLARQLRRSSVSVVLNVAEGAGARDGRRRMRYGDALGSALETQAGIEVAVAIGYLPAMPAELARRFAHILGVLTKVSR